MKEINQKLLWYFCMQYLNRIFSKGWYWMERWFRSKIDKRTRFIRINFKNYFKRLSCFRLLTGPARGYVKKELEKFGIPYFHTYPKNHNDLNILISCT